jgi:two-component system sensor kinase FixL
VTLTIVSCLTGDAGGRGIQSASVVGDVALLVHSDAIVRGIRVFLNIDPQPPAVYGDKMQLQQVMLNSLLNAFEAWSPAGAGSRGHD